MKKRTTHSVPGDNSGLMLRKPNVEALAPLLKAHLDDARAQMPARIVEQAPTAGGETVADAFVEHLNAHGVDCLFINPGSDVAPIQESIAKFDAQGRRAPRLILCPHESVALAAAHGYFMVTGRPQVVLVHADVGTRHAARCERHALALSLGERGIAARTCNRVAVND